MTRRRVVLGAGLVALALLGTAGALLASRFFPSGGANAAGGSDSGEQRLRVTVIRPQRGGVERTVSRPGSVHSFQYADLYAKVAGYLRNQTVDIGDRVKKDQVLAEVYAPEIAANVAQAAASLKKARSHVEVMKSRVVASQADLQQARTELEQTQADLETAVAMLKLRQQQYNRIQTLAEMNSVQQELADERLEAQRAAQAKERATRKGIETARAKVASAKANVQTAQAELEDARAQVQVAEAALTHAQAIEAYTKIQAPFAGVITRRSYHEGDYIRDGAGNGNRPILTVARTDLMRVIVDVPDPAVPYTRRGDPAEIRIDTLPGKVFKDKVARIGMSEDYNSRTMRAEIDLPNPKGLLTNGMFGSVTINLGANKNALTIPSDCLAGGEKNGQRSVYVVRGGKAHQVAVRVGLDDGIRAEVLSGLRPDDLVIEQRPPGLSDGTPVEVTGGDDKVKN